jgi:type IV pilus assembly protein PilM
MTVQPITQVLMRNTATRSVVGVNVEPGSVTAVEGPGGRVAVERAATASLAPGVVREGEVVDVATLADVLREMFAEHKLSKRVRLGVANQRIVMRTIELPPLHDEKQLASAIRFQAQDHIPMPLDQAVLEYHSLGVVETANGPRMRVVLVAARRDMIERLLESARQAGLRPTGIDLAAFAMVRALHTPGRDAGTLYVSVGGVTNVAVAVGATCVFTRVVATGSESMAAELAERRGLTIEHAHGWLKHVGVQLPLDDVDGDPAIVLEARSVLMDGVRRIVDDVRNTLDFYTMQEGAVPAARAVLTGQAVAIPGFADQFGGGLGIPLEVGVVSEARPGGFGGIESGKLAIAAGLTIEELAAA